MKETWDPRALARLLGVDYQKIEKAMAKTPMGGAFHATEQAREKLWKVGEGVMGGVLTKELMKNPKVRAAMKYGRKFGKSRSSSKRRRGRRRKRKGKRQRRRRSYTGSQWR